MPRPPILDHLRKLLIIDRSSFRQGVAVFDCIVTNPDGTGFGGGAVEASIGGRKDGDDLRLRAVGDLSLRGANIYFQGRPLATSQLSGTMLRFRFEHGVKYDGASTLLQAVEFWSPTPLTGRRDVILRITDADGD